MSWRMECICDVCGRRRGEANHWLLFWREMTDRLEIHRWNEDLAHTDNWGHLCSQECAHKLLATFPAQSKEPLAPGAVAGDDDCERAALEYIPLDCGREHQVGGTATVPGYPR